MKFFAASLLVVAQAAKLQEGWEPIPAEHTHQSHRDVTTTVSVPFEDTRDVQVTETITVPSYSLSGVDNSKVVPNAEFPVINDRDALTHDRHDLITVNDDIVETRYANVSREEYRDVQTTGYNTITETKFRDIPRMAYTPTSITKVRKVPKTVWSDEQVTLFRSVPRKVYDTISETRYRDVMETRFREVNKTVFD